jgi:translation initiation factor 2B subunit (eIF-2B alpha/beta/delta family)
VAIEVESGAGVAAQSSEYGVKVVAAAPTYKFAPRYQLKK